MPSQAVRRTRRWRASRLLRLRTSSRVRLTLRIRNLSTSTRKGYRAALRYSEVCCRPSGPGSLPVHSAASVGGRSSQDSSLTAEYLWEIQDGRCLQGAHNGRSIRCCANALPDVRSVFRILPRVWPPTARLPWLWETAFPDPVAVHENTAAMGRGRLS